MAYARAFRGRRDAGANERDKSDCGVYDVRSIRIHISRRARAAVSAAIEAKAEWGKAGPTTASALSTPTLLFIVEPLFKGERGCVFRYIDAKPKG